MRQALYQAIDIDAIHKSTMRGLSKPTGGMTPSPAQATPEIEKRLPFDPNAAKKLLADAGYPKGFEVQLDCPNNRYVNDEKICQAVAAMWAKIGVNTKLVTLPRAQYFPKLEKLDTSIYMLGWGGASTDSIFTLQPVLSTYSGKGDGDYNYGRYTNSPTFDALVAEIKVEMNTEKRLALIRARAPDPQQRDPHAAAAPAGHPVGGAQQRRASASCGQPGLADLGEGEVVERLHIAAMGVLVRILLAVLLVLATWNSVRLVVRRLGAAATARRSMRSRRSSASCCWAGGCSACARRGCRSARSGSCSSRCCSGRSSGCSCSSASCPRRTAACSCGSCSLRSALRSASGCRGRSCGNARPERSRPIDGHGGAAATPTMPFAASSRDA